MGSIKRKDPSRDILDVLFLCCGQCIGQSGLPLRRPHPILELSKILRKNENFVILRCNEPPVEHSFDQEDIKEELGLNLLTSAYRAPW